MPSIDVTDVLDDTVTELTTSLQAERKVTARTQDFSITSSEAIKEQISSITNTLTVFLGAIAAISLLVGAIGVANSMFTSVLEKTREIGILKALGATNNEVMQVFLFESALFGLVGGILGALLGMLMASLMSMLGLSLGITGSVTTLVTPQLLVIAIALSTIIGVISGLAPARNASKLNPIEALRHE